MSQRSAGFGKHPYVIAAEDLRTNRAQWEAYNASGHCVILAGPGSGKTKTLTIKLAKMLAEDVLPPRRIACITYSNQCVRELRRRLAAFGIQDGQRTSIGTLHSFCLQHIVLPYAHLASIPKKYPISVASAKEIEKLQEQAIEATLGTNTRWGPRFDRYRRMYLDRQAGEWRSVDAEAARAIETYEALLDAEGLVDFDGMVLLGLYLVETFEWIRRALTAKFPALVVDEYQDLGTALDRIVRCLCFKVGMRLVAVGDPDQSIYGFTGADPSLLRDLANRPDVTRVNLQLNYRCGSAIIRASEVALGETRGFRSGASDPGIIFFHEFSDGVEAQAKGICESIIPAALARREGRKLGDVAVLYLDKYDGDEMAEAVKSTGWQFIRVDGNSPYQPSPVTYWIEECAAWCGGEWKTGRARLSDLVARWQRFNESICSERERLALRGKLVKFLYDNRGGNTNFHQWLRRFYDVLLQETLERELRLSDDKEKVEALLGVTAAGGPLERCTVAFFGGQGGSPDHLTLSTLHSSKGLEYDVVVMLGLEEGRIPQCNAPEEAIREKRRLFYVGLTRARHEVHLVYSGWYEKRYGRGRGRRHKLGRSRFIDEVQGQLQNSDE